jgi:diketogulonate reductase-like aldo/keto reductase
LGPAPPDERFHDQLGAMVQTGDDGLIAGIGMSNITLDHLLLLRALEVAEIVCVQTCSAPPANSIVIGVACRRGATAA